MNGRTFLTPTPLALVPRLPGRGSSDVDASTASDPPSLETLVDAVSAPTRWAAGVPDPPFQPSRDGNQPTTVHDARSVNHPDAKTKLSALFTRRRSVTGRDPSDGSIRKPLCAVPDAFEMSTDQPVIEMAVAVAPLSWGVAVVTGTVADPDEHRLTRRLVTELADRTVSMIRDRLRPSEVC